MRECASFDSVKRMGLSRRGPVRPGNDIADETERFKDLAVSTSRAGG